MNRKTIVLLSVVAGVALLAAAYLGISEYYKERFVPNTKIAGVDVGGMTYTQAEEVFQNLAKDFKMDLMFRDDAEETISGPDFDFAYRNDDDIHDALEQQDSVQWPVIIVQGEQYPITITYNKEKLAKVIKALPELKKKNMVQPEDAHIEYKKGEYQIIPEVMGTKLKAKEVIAYVGDELKKGERTADIEDLYINPEIYKDDPTLASEQERLTADYSAVIKYKLPNGDKKVLNGKNYLEWLTLRDDGAYERDDEKWDAEAAAFVADMAEKVDTTEKDHKFKTNTGEVVELPGLGYYGWKIDQEAEIEQMNEDIDNGKTVKRKPVYAKTEKASPDDNYGFGDTYVEVNLSDQTLWYYEDGEEKFSTPVVSGLNTSQRRTPSGAFFVYDKQQDKDLVGAGYTSHVNYWMRLTEMGVGIHDATWRGSFGGSIWTYDGSHGCINVPYSAAQTLYEMVETYTPVAVYY